MTLTVLALSTGACGGDDGDEFGAGLSAEEVVERLKAEGAPITDVQAFTAETDPNNLLGRPGEYTGKAAFHDERLEDEALPNSEEGERVDAEAGGSVEVFENTEDAEERADYVRGFTEGGGVFGEYNYLRGHVFLRVANELTPTQAEEYERALKGL